MNSGLIRLSSRLGQDAQQLPAEVQRLLDGAVGGVALADVALLKLVGELGEELVVVRQRGLAQDGHELLGVLAAGVGGEELVHGAGVVLAGLADADALVLQTAQGGQHVHRRHDALAVQLAAEDDLALGDVAGQVGDGVGLVVLGHGQDRDHGDRALLALAAAGALVHGGKVGVQVAGIAAAAGDFLLGGGDLTQSLGVVGDIGQDDQHLHVLLKGQVLGGGQRHARGGDTLDGGVVGEVGEDDGAVDGAGAAEVVDEVLGLLKGDADGGEDDGEGLVVAQHAGLTGDLRGEGRVGQTGAGEDRQLLAADQGVQAVDGAHAGLDELGGVGAGGGVHGQAVDVHVRLGQDGGAAVDGLAHAVEDAAEHVLGHGQLLRVAQEADLGLGQVDALRGLEQLHDRLVALDLQHLAAAGLAVGQLDLAQLVVGDALDVLHDHQRAGDLSYGFILFDHASSPPAMTSSISRFICASMAS